MLHSSVSRLERQSAELAIGWWWPAVAEVNGNEIAAHLAGPARKTSSSQTVSLLFARDNTAFELYNTIKVVALAAFKSKYYVRQQNNFALRPAVVPVISATDRWSRDAVAIYWESCVRVRLRLLLLLLLLLLQLLPTTISKCHSNSLL